MSTKGTLLWADDDGPLRFEYDEYCIKEKGWQVLWARSIDEAATKLGAIRVDAVLLDQMLPFAEGEAQRLVWSGCLVLRWLRGKARPALAPEGIERDLWSRQPLDENRTVRVKVASAFHNPDVLAAMQEASEQDRHITLLSKPTDTTRILEFLR